MGAKEAAVCDDFEGEEILFACSDGITMECVCPKCGAHHRMKIRGWPRQTAEVLPGVQDVHRDARDGGTAVHAGAGRPRHRVIIRSLRAG